jgi:hypothetical protein
MLLLSLIPLCSGRLISQLAFFSQDTKGRSLRLAHPVFTLGLEALREGNPHAAQTGVRVIEFEHETARAFYDVAHDEKTVRQMSASGAYLQLLPRALEAVAAVPAVRAAAAPGASAEF